MLPCPTTRLQQAGKRDAWPRPRVRWAQPFNVLRYEPGQHYDSHYDIFEPESYGPQPSQRVRS